MPHNTRKEFTFIKNPLMNVKNKMYKNDSRNKRKTAQICNVELCKKGGEKTTDFEKRISVILDQKGVLWRRF